MTALLTPTEAERAAATRTGMPRPAPVGRAIGSATAAALISLLVVAAVVLVAWGVDSRSHLSAGPALRAAGALWLFIHHAPIRLTFGTLGLTPLGFFALPVALLIRAGAQVGRELRGCGRLEAARSLLALVASYGVIATIVAALADSGPIRVGVLVAPLSAMAVAALAGGLGLALGLRHIGGRDALAGPATVTQEPGEDHSGWLRRHCARAVSTGTTIVMAASRALGVPGVGSARLAAAALRGGAVAASVILGAGALLVAGALATSAGRAGALQHALDPGIAGGLVLAVLGVVYAPNAAVFGSSYVAGPGFAVGTGTSVTGAAAHLSVVPSFPLLAALPQHGGGAGLSWIGYAGPVVAGVLAGVVVHRRIQGSWRVRGAATVGTGIVAGALLGVLGAVAGGPVGSGALSVVGPCGWKLGVAATTEVAVLAACTVAIATLTHRSTMDGAATDSAGDGTVIGGEAVIAVTDSVTSSIPVRDKPD